MRILVSGTFDDLHPGHLFLLNEAQKRACTAVSASGGQSRGELWVIIARDENVRRIKGSSPLQNEKERKEALEKAFPKAHVVLGDEWDFLEPVREIDPDLILLGYDQKLPPDVAIYDLPYKIERLPAFKPEIHKSSLRRKRIRE